MLKELIQAAQTATGLTVHAFAAQAVSPDCIVYNLIPQADNGRIVQSRLEIRIITHTLLAAMDYADKLNAALIACGDDPKLAGLLSIEQNGGGRMFEGGTETVHTLLYYSIKERSKSL